MEQPWSQFSANWTLECKILETLVTLILLFKFCFPKRIFWINIFKIMKSILTLAINWVQIVFNAKFINWHLGFKAVSIHNKKLQKKCSMIKWQNKRKNKFKNKMNIIKTFVIGYLNLVFEKGFKIPIPNNY
jgi:hypothetical protein